MESIDYKSIVRKDPPWKLNGEGYIFIYRFPDKLLPTFDLDSSQRKRILSIGAMFLVDYQDSPVGPYHEILIAPGIFKMGKIRRFSISKILVSSMDSVVNGVNNWGIPKELASFTRQTQNEKDSWSIENANFQLKADLTSRSLKFPISTAIMPLKLAQRLNDDLMLTTARAKGKASFAKIEEFSIDGSFPQIQELKALLGLKVSDFQMFFDTPTILKNHFQ